MGPPVEDPDPGDLSAPAPASAEATEVAAALVGRVISQRYRIDKLLAMGGMGAVYQGHHLHLKKRVAVKVLHPETENLPELVSRFQREAIAGAHVVHPHVAAATDFGRLEDGSFFLVLEYVAGETLFDLLRREKLSTARAVHIARQIAGALAAAQAMGIVHRDLKPSNVMLVEGQQDFVKLIDFGLAKVPVDQVVGPQVPPPGEATAPRPRITAVGALFGTFAYLAPEAATGMDSVDARADLYALGIILYQMLAGRHPFGDIESASAFAERRLQPPPPFSEAAPNVDVPPALAALVMRLLAKDPAARYATGVEVIEALDALDLEEDVIVTRRMRRSGAPLEDARHPSAPRETSRYWAGTRSGLPLVLFGLAALTLATAAGVHFRSSSAAAGRAPAAPVSAALLHR
jgi:eukaryotic-like serine/threonine-protein kinase